MVHVDQDRNFCCKQDWEVKKTTITTISGKCAHYLRMIAKFELHETTRLQFRRYLDFSLPIIFIQIIYRVVYQILSSL